MSLHPVFLKVLVTLSGQDDGDDLRLSPQQVDKKDLVLARSSYLVPFLQLLAAL